MKYTTDWVTVRYGETDQMRFVHHSNYLRYFELARLEWLSSMGISYADMEREGILMPVVHTSLNFKSPLFFGDLFRVAVSLNKTPTATLEFDYLITNQQDKVICTGNTVLAFLSPETKMPMRCPKLLLDKFV